MYCLLLNYLKIEIKSVENIKFDEYNVKIEALEIDKKIKEIAKTQNNFKEVSLETKASDKDLVIFDYKATIDNKEFQVVKVKIPN